MAEYIEREELLKKLKIIKINKEEHFEQFINAEIDWITHIPPAEVQPIVYAHKTINVGRRSYCSNCGKLAIMEDFCSKCGAKVKGRDVDNNTRDLTDEETDIYNSWIEAEAETIDEISLL